MGKTHAKKLARHPLAELAAVADANPRAAEAVARELAPNANIFADGHAMIRDGGLDVLYVALPPCAHSGEVEAAAAKGVHVFMEKPLALDSARASAMVAAIEKAGVTSQVGFHMRFLKSVQAMKAMLEDGSAGRPLLFNARYWVNMEGNDWWRRREGSGGQVLEQIIHMYDLALHWMGRPETVRGVSAKLARQGDATHTIEDTSVGVVRFASGALASITGSNNAVRMHFFGDVHMVCENAVFNYTSTGQHWVVPDKAVICNPDGAVLHAFTEDADPYQLETDDFLSAIRAGRPARTPARHGLEAMLVAEQVRDGVL